MTTKITEVIGRDIRFPTSRTLDGSDAMNPDPDYSAAYLTLRTNHAGLEGNGLTFTIGRGNELCVAAIEALARPLIGRPLDSITDNLGAFWRELTGDSQLRWVGPEKGVVHLAVAAVVNAIWDLHAKVSNRPVWQLLCEMTPNDLVQCVDFRYLTDVLTPDHAIDLLTELQPTRDQRIQQMIDEGYPTYTTSAGWLGYDDERLRSQCRDLINRGWTHFKIKVGRCLDDDRRRCSIIREEIGWDRKLMVDANQVWDVDEAISHVRALADFKPWFVEEPTSPDDILGHAKIAKSVSPIKVATGEVCHNRVMFKQFLQAGAMQICQVDSCRLGGVNEVIAVLLLAKAFNVPVCFHAGGVGLCEYVQHLAMFDYVSVSGSLNDRIAEYSDHLHEHFFEPVHAKNGRYFPPTEPGYSATMLAQSLDAYEYPSGSIWTSPSQI